MLPIDDPEMLVAVIWCLTRENMMLSPEMVKTVNQVIDLSFDDAFDPELRNTTEGMLQSVTCMITTMEQVVEDIMPLLPETFNVLSMYQEKANFKIKNDIKAFYLANKNSLSSREILTLLAFTDTQIHTLKEFGVDTSKLLFLY